MTKSNTDTFTFFGLHLIYSNIHQSYFTDKNITYNSSEQCIQSIKAELFDDDKTQYLIMHSSNPFEIKQLGSIVKNFVRYKWESNAQGIAVNGMCCKFAQNEALKRELLNAPKTIVETSRDTLWGTREPLHERGVLLESTWNGKDLMNKVYNMVHKQLK